MDAINGADTAWILISSALVMLMTPGLGLFYGGLVRDKNVLSTIMHSFFILALVSVQWVLWGYTLAFGPSIGGFIGGLNWLGLNGVGIEPNADYAATIPHQAFMIFQMMFAVITPALISGAFAERKRFKAFVVFTLLWSTLVYAPVAHWVWAVGGWIRTMGALDFAGGTVVHITSGISALVCALVLGKRIGYGARAINASGINALPQTVFPGGALVGCDAGYLNVSRIKGSHAAIKTGMLAAEAAFDALQAGRQHDTLKAYPAAFEKSWLYIELNKDRNFKNWFKHGLTIATLMNGFEQFVLRGRMPWTLRRTKPDHAYLKPASECKPIDYPKPDGKLTFDRLSSVFISNTNHEENQPIHLTLKNASVPVDVNLAKYAGPCLLYTSDAADE